MAVMPVNWDAVGAVAEAAGSVVAGVSIGIAVLTLSRDRRRWAAEQARTATERRRAETALASTVSVQSLERVEPGTARVQLHNAGERPIFDVRVSSRAGARRIKGPDELDPTGALRRLRGDEEREYLFETLPGEEQSSRPAVEFTDNEGRRWVRVGLGTPERAGPS